MIRTKPWHIEIQFKAISGFEGLARCASRYSRAKISDRITLPYTGRATGSFARWASSLSAIQIVALPNHLVGLELLFDIAVLKEFTDKHAAIFQ